LAGHWSLFLEGRYGTPNLTVVVSEAEASVLAPMADFRRTFPLAVLLTLWFVLLLGYVLIRKSTEPLAQLQEGTRRLAVLDFSNPVHITSGDEFEDLATSFNTMADHLRQQLTESARLNAALRQASESLRENETRLRTILETAAVAVVTTDDTGVVESFNRTAETVFGYSRDEVVGRPASVLLADTALTLRGAGGPFAEPGPARELLGRRKDGTTFPLELDVSEAEVAGRTLFTGFARDVSERRRAEEERSRLEAQLRQAQKLETIGTLAGGIAHDFNNILTAVIGYLDLALPEVPAESRALADLREVRRAADRAKDLVRQILLFSRQGEQERRPVNLASLIKETLNLIRATLPTTIEIRETVDRTTAPVLADPTQLHQVLMNLCTNAAHAMRRAGVLEIGLGTVSVDAGMAEAPPTLAPGRYVQLRVRDTGQGMDRTTLDHLFEPFFTTKPLGEGTGLGLSVVHGIVTNHGGAIDVESTPGAGTTFTIYLPVAATTPEAAPAPAATDLTGHEHLLVVDDDPAIAQVTKRLLERQGYRVTARTSSPEALELLRADAGQYDAMLTDQTMPGLTGLQLAEAALQLRPDLPIILTSGMEDTPLADQGRALGVREFLVKPVNTRDLGEAIRRVLKRVAEQRRC
jgi:PAS domain S-box-containing protein